MTLPARRGRYAARRWEPFAGLPAADDLFDQMSRMLTTAFPEAARISVQSWSPPVDVQETDDAFVIEADMPGVRPDDVSVELERNELRITGEYGAEQGGEGEQQQQQRTRRSGRFDYRVTLPGEVDAESAAANLENGVLRLQLRKAGRARQRIQVQGGPAQSSQSGSQGS
jgi:HSP20 family protein